MTTTVVFCSPSDRLHQVCKSMAVHRLRCLPVLEDQRVIGVITARDLQSALKREPKALTSMKAADLMNRDVATCHPFDPIDASMLLMRQRRLHRLPAVDSNGRLVGMLTLGDISERLHRPRAQWLCHDLELTVAIFRH